MLGIVNKSDLDDNQVRGLEGVIWEFLECFAAETGKTHLIMHDIELTSETPFQSKAYKVSPKQSEIMKAEINRMLEIGVIREGYSEYCSLLMLVEVPGKEARPCVDYMRINSLTKRSSLPPCLILRRG